MTAIARLAPVSHPFDGLRLVMEVAKSDSLLAREQHDVIVRHAQLNGIAEERDFVRRIRCELLEGLEDPESFDGEEGLRRAHVHEDARAAVLLAFEDDCTKKPSRFLGGFPFEQFRPQKTAFHRDLVLHRDRKSTRLNSSHSQISYAVFCLKKKKQRNSSSTLLSTCSTAACEY